MFLNQDVLGDLSDLPVVAKPAAEPSNDDEFKARKLEMQRLIAQGKLEAATIVAATLPMLAAKVMEMAMDTEDLDEARKALDTLARQAEDPDKPKDNGQFGAGLTLVINAAPSQSTRVVDVRRGSAAPTAAMSPTTSVVEVVDAVLTATDE